MTTSDEYGEAELQIYEAQLDLEMHGMTPLNDDPTPATSIPDYGIPIDEADPNSLSVVGYDREPAQVDGIDGPPMPVGTFEFGIPLEENALYDTGLGPGTAGYDMNNPDGD